MPARLDSFDPDLALERAGGNRDLAADLFAMLCDDLPGRRAALEAAHKAGDLEALHHHAHKLHGSTLYCGVPALQEAVVDLSMSLKRAHTTELDPQIQAVLEAIDEVLATRCPDF